MLERFKTSLVRPSEIGRYAFDHIWRILFYGLLITLFVTLPAALVIIFTDDISYDTLQNTRSEIVAQGFTENDLSISDGVLTGNGEISFLCFNMPVYVNTMPNKVLLGISLNKFDMCLVFNGSIYKTYSYADLGITSFRFNDLINDDMSTSFEAYNELYRIASIVYDDIRPYTATGTIILYFIMSFFSYIIMSLLVALVVKLFIMIPYGIAWKIVFYSLTISEIGRMLDGFFGISLFYFATFILSIVFVFKAIKTLYLNQMLKSDRQE